MDKFTVIPDSPHHEGILIDNEDKRVRLWEVYTTYHKDRKHHEATTYVLAHTDELACNQAQCVLGIASYSRPKDVVVTHSSAVRVEFAIQGWSERRF
jgi:hypothetical protein